MRRIIGKAIMKLVKYDLQDAVGSLQLCAGHDAGCKTAIHAMNTIFENEATEAIILVDASNAFNSLNRQVTLLICGAICPLSTIPSLAPTEATHNSLSTVSIYYQDKAQHKVTLWPWRRTQSGHIPSFAS